jgi:mono/diheme cytochrome c family protein
VQDDTGASGIAFYEHQVRPVLEQHCFKCHGAGEKVKAELRLTTRAGVLRGGERGAAVNLDAPETSLLLEMLSYRDENHQMPPSGKLPQEQIEVLAQWIRMGLPMPDVEEAAGEAREGDSLASRMEAGRRHWAYQRVQRPAVPEVRDAQWVANPVDAFLLARLEARGLAPAPPATRAVLARRAYYDLLGLPPSLEAVERFVGDPRGDDEAWAALVEELLASPHYGEKYARHWLDVVRYAETNGYERDTPKPEMWRYRDYVINAFNEDKPYDVFVKEQLAGDELDVVGPEQIIATGYYRLGIWDDEPADKAQGKYDVLDGIVDTTAQAFLGTTMGCARCHEHKIDPFPQADYYRLLSMFHNITNMDKTRIVRSIMTPEEEAAYNEKTQRKRMEEVRLEGELREFEEEFARKLREKDPALQGPLHASDMTGLYYRLYRDSYQRLPDFEALRSEFEGRIEHNFFDLATRTRDDAFAYVFEANLNVPVTGTYTFHLDADDGARLKVDGVTVVDYDGLHEVGREQEGRIELAAGTHDIRLEYFQYMHNFGLHVYWSGPSFERRALSKEPQMLDLPKLIAERGAEVLDETDLNHYASLRKRLETRRAFIVPGGKFATCVAENGPTSPETFVFVRGNPHVPGEAVSPAFPEVLSPPPFVPPALPPGTASTGRRRALAEWIASGENPLAARVMVNRLWQWHFGRGIVRSSNNFGLGGEAPTHPELLDWLASEFVAQGWRMKPLHRLIMTSRAYRMSSRFDAAAYALDPGNDLHWRFDMRRLSAEEIRDSILAVNGTLNREVGGPSVYPPMPKEALATSSMPKSVWGLSPPEQHTRRSIYIHVKRSLLTPILQDYDLADTDNSCPVRFVTTQPAQALDLLNSEFAQTEAGRLARHVREEAGEAREAQLARAVGLVTQRPAGAEELGRAMAFMEAFEARGLDSAAALERFCLLALNLNEFIFVE